MAFSSQIFKAPTLKTTPKLKKTMVSSSVFSGVKSANIAKVNYGGLAKAIGSQPKAIDVENICSHRVHWQVLLLIYKKMF